MDRGPVEKAFHQILIGGAELVDEVVPEPLPLSVPGNRLGALDQQSGQARQVLDVRSPTERTEEDLPGSIHLYLPYLADRAVDELDRNLPVWVGCASGYRASVASGILERLGFEVTMTIQGGIQDLRGLKIRVA